MALAKTDWKQYRGTNSEIPPDIFFQVLRSSTRNENIEMEKKEEADKTNMIAGHKLLLAGASPVFRANFFGPLRMAGEVMVVKETTVEAFAALIDFIYWPPGKETFSLKHIASFEQLCEIVEISERYQVHELKKVAMEALEKLPISSKTVISVANVADKFKVFPDVRNLLIDKSLSFLDNNLKSANDAFSFMIEAKTDFAENGLELLYDLLREKEKKKNIDRGTIIFSKPEEHRAESSVLTRFTESHRNWKIKFDLMIMNQGGNYGLYLENDNDLAMQIVINGTNLYVRSEPKYPNGDNWPWVHLSSPKPLAPNEWRNLEIINKEVDPGKCLLTIVYGGERVFEQESLGSRDLLNYRLRALSGHTYMSNPVINLRGLSVMTI